MFLLLMALVGHSSTATRYEKIERVKRGGKFLKNRDLNRISLFVQKWALGLLPTDTLPQQYIEGKIPTEIDRKISKLIEPDRN